MNCPSCNAALEPNARFCGVCGHPLSPAKQAAPAARPPTASPAAASAEVTIDAKPKRPRQASASKAADPFLGHVLNNRFKIESKIGEGGFGAVYRGVQLGTGRKVALKLLHPEMTKDKNLVARFRREGQVLCNLRDAHTITTFDFDQTSDGTLYIAMELLEGKSLHHVFQAQAPLDWRRVFKIIGEMCSSLAEAHALGIVHRDLKPENVYLEPRPGNQEFVKILDFGIAKVMRGEAIDPQAPQLTATGQTLGTLEYMSPEQLMGKQLDGRSDVYALGVVAYEMITKRLPFPDAKGPAGLITAQLRQTPQPPSKVNVAAQLPPSVDKVVLKCLEKDKNNRYADVTALATAVQEALQGAHNQGEEPWRPPTGPIADVAPGFAPMQLPHLPQTGHPGGVPVPASAAVPAVIPPAGSAPVAVASLGGPLAPLAPRTPQGYPGARPGTGPVPSGPAVHVRPLTQTSHPQEPLGESQRPWIWVMLGVVALGAAAGAALAFLL
ncbi:MAG: protein kinase [Kofleriaceae bacterium]